MNNNSPSLPVDELCDGIRRNDPSINKVQISVCNHSQVDSLLKALLENNAVSTLVFDLCRSYSNENVPITSLLQYLKQCTSIRAVELMSSRVSSLCLARDEREGQLLRALAENPAMELTNFESQILLLPNVVTALLEAKAHCLKHLHIERTSDRRFNGLNVSQLRRLARAIGSLQVLESVYVRFPGSEYTLLMLQTMSAHSCLRKLSVKDCDTGHVTVIAVSALLQSKVQLETLELDGFCWDMTKMEYLVQGLESCETLVNLTVRDCHFAAGNDLASEFGRCLHNCRNVRRLRLINCAAVRVAPSLLMPTGNKNAEGTNCMGSSLRVLELRDELRFLSDRVLRPLTMKESQLVKLTLDDLSVFCSRKLTRYVPGLQRLRELHLFFRHCFHFEPFLRALRKNGSLHVVSVSCKNDARDIVPMLGSLDCRTMQSMCDRNRWAPGMLRALGSNEDNLKTALMPLPFIPSLCKVVAQSPRLAPTFLLAGMLAADDAIGFIFREKRMRCPDP
jgi:hypothetical protein